MVTLMQRRREMMQVAAAEGWVEILPSTDWSTSTLGFVAYPYRAITKDMIPMDGISSISVLCPFTLGTYMQWGVNTGSGGYYVRMYDSTGDYLSSSSLWGSNADNRTISLASGTAFIRVGFQRGTDATSRSDNFTLVQPLIINGTAYNTKFKGQTMTA